jgi:hypothetical protein
MGAAEFNVDSVHRALDAHKAGGLIRDWRQVPGAGTRITVDLVDGHARFRLESLREAYIFVAGLASAHHAQLRALP